MNLQKSLNKQNLKQKDQEKYILQIKMEIYLEIQEGIQ